MMAINTRIKVQLNVVNGNYIQWPTEIRTGWRQSRRTAMCIFVLRVLCNESHRCTWSKRYVFFPPFLPPLPPTNTRPWLWAAAGCEGPDISPSTRALEAAFAFCSPSWQRGKREMNGLPRRGWHTVFCNSYLFQRPSFRRASLFCANWQGWELTVFEHTDSWVWSNWDKVCLEKLKSTSDRGTATMIANEFSSDILPPMSADVPSGCYCALSLEVLVPKGDWPRKGLNRSFSYTAAW